MNYIGTAVTDVGNVKNKNQDSLCVKIANTKEVGQIVMAVVCDGMGGLEKGELASAVVVRKFSEWFEEVLPKRLPIYSWKELSDEWIMLVKNLNHKIMDYGKKNDVTLGTTLTAILIIEEKYMIIHVGDTRIYEISEKMKQLTEDQTYIAREIKSGKMTLDQAAKDPNRNMLLQCIGASKIVEPEIIYGEVQTEKVFLLCSDGFRHVLTEKEIQEHFQTEQMTDVAIMQQKSKQVIEIVKQRKERDNISVALIKCTE